MVGGDFKKFKRKEPDKIVIKNPKIKFFELIDYLHELDYELKKPWTKKIILELIRIELKLQGIKKIDKPIIFENMMSYVRDIYIELEPRGNDVRVTVRYEEWEDPEDEESEPDIYEIKTCVTKEYLLGLK